MGRRFIILLPLNLIFIVFILINEITKIGLNITYKNYLGVFLS